MKEYNYSKIYNTYNNNLLDKLRDFKINDDLALWVPNEDITQSVINLIDSIEETEIKIIFDEKQFKSLKIDNLRQSLSHEGEINVNEISRHLIFKRLLKKQKIILKKIKKKKNSKFEDKFISDSDRTLLEKNYFINLKKIKIPKDFSKTNLVHSSLIKLDYKDEKCDIEILVNPTNHLVVDTFFQTKQKITEINSFCNYLLYSMINLPINEIKDHLLIKLEYYLRPKNFEKNKGIILKNKGGTIFDYFQIILDNFYIQYQKKNNIEFGINFYNYQIPEEWKRLNQKIKIKKIEEVLNNFNLKIGEVETDHFKVENLIESNRLFLKMGENLLKSNKNHLFFELEKFLNKNINVKFEVYYVNRIDENQLRN